MIDEKFKLEMVEKMATIETNLNNHLSNHKIDRKLYLGGLIAILIAVVGGILVNLIGG